MAAMTAATTKAMATVTITAFTPNTAPSPNTEPILRGLAKIKLPFMAQGFWPLARRERRAYPAHGSVRSEQRSQRPKDQARMGKVILARPLKARTFFIALCVK